MAERNSVNDVLWNTKDAPDPINLGLMGWVLVILRGVPLALLVFGGLIILLAIRLIELPLFGVRRPITPFIAQFVSRSAFRILGMSFRTSGELMQQRGAVVANHSSWLDIFALNARKRVYFVSKAEVAKWPGIGWLARATGTVFIERDRKKAREQTKVFETRLKAGHKLLFFPREPRPTGCGFCHSKQHFLPRSSRTNCGTLCMCNLSRWFFTHPKVNPTGSMAGGERWSSARICSRHSARGDRAPSS